MCGWGVRGRGQEAPYRGYAMAASLWRQCMKAAVKLRHSRVQLSRSVLSDYCNTMDCSTQGFPVHHQLTELAQTHVIESAIPSNHLILCSRLLYLPSIFPSIRVFSNKLVLLIAWPKYWSFNFSISPSNEYSLLISFRMDWLDLLAVQGTLKSLLQHPSSKASILRHSVFFIVQLSHPYMTTGKTIGYPAAAAKSLQSCPTLCDPIEGSPPGSLVPGILNYK